MVDGTCADGDHRWMEQADLDALDDAVSALNERDLEPLVSLMAPDMVWTGQSPRWLWWRQAPS